MRRAPPRSPVYQPIASGPRQDLHDLHEWFDLLRGLRSSLHHRTFFACRLYHRGLLLLGDDSELAFLNFVAAIEALADKWKCERVVADLLPDVRKALAALDDGNAKEKVTKCFLRYTGAGAGFRGFACAHVLPDFWNQGEGPIESRASAQNLDELLRKVYLYRSGLLHDGIPLPPEITDPMPSEGDVPELVHGGTTPSVRFVERLTNHLIGTFVRRNQQGHDAPPR